LRLEQDDLKSSGFGIPWGHTRSYSNRNTNNAAGLNGSSWMTRQLRYLTFQGDVGEGQPQKICVVTGPQTSLWFEHDAGSTYRNVYAGLSTLVWDEGLQEYTLGAPTGESWVFADHTVTDLAGKLLRVIDPARQIASMEYDEAGLLARFSQSMDGRSAAYAYAYVSLAVDATRISTVTYQVDDKNVRRVVFSYYTSTEARGNLGDLCLADVQEWDAGTGTWSSVRKSHYRYYRTGDANGFEHGLKYALQPTAYEQMRAAGIDPLRASETELASFADYYFEYDGSKRVSLERIMGGLEAYSFIFEDNSPVPSAEEVNEWATRCTETRPDGSTMRVYCNAAGSSLLNILTEPFAAGGRVWYEYTEYNESFRQVLFAHPSAVDSVSEPSGPGDPLGVTLKTDEGLIDVIEYYDTTNPTVGAVEGLVYRKGTQEGSEGDVVWLVKYEFIQHTAAGQTVNKLSVEYSYPVAGMSDEDAPTTSYEYTWQTDSEDDPTLQVAERVRTLPTVSTDENGTGETQQDHVIFDSFGRVTWEMDARGVITYRSYVTATGALLQRIQDVDTSLMSDVPEGWETLPGFGQHLITDYESDAQGRTTMEMGPWHEVQLNVEDTQPTAIRTVQFTVYDDDAHEVRRASGWMRGTGASVQFNTVGGVRVTRMDAGGNVIDEITSARECTCGPLTAQEPLPQCRWSRWTHRLLDAWGRVIAQRAYFAIPASGEGELGANYDETLYSYDEMGRQNRVVDATGTIEKRIFDVRNLITSALVGTVEGTGSNLLTVVENIYDEGSGGGDGLLTQTRAPVDATSGNDRVVDFTYDYRGNQLTRDTDDGTRLLISATEYDNLNRPIQVTDYHTSMDAGDRTRQSRKFYDARGRVYKREIDGVDPSTGDITETLAGQNWYDAVSNVIKASEPGRNAFTKTVYDGMNRPTASYLCCVPGEAGVPTGCDNDVDDDTVLEQNESDYDPAGNEIESRLSRRLDTATGTGALNGPNGDQPQARITYQMIWPDAIGRPRNVADYGTNGGLVPSRPGVAPARSDTILVSTTLYKDSGDANRSIDPMGIETHWENDHLGRRIKLMEGIVVGSFARTSSCTPSAPRTTEFAWHASGQLQRLTLVNPTTGNQVTRWIFGTTLDDSGVASNRLLRAKIYPESDDRPAPLDSGPDGVYARLEYTYNRQGDVVQFTDADGTVHEYEYNKAGRLTDDRATTIADHLNDTVRRISRAYDNRGMLALVSSYDALTSGSILNQVALAYGPFGQLIEDVQAHGGAVDGSTPKVQYGYTDGSGNTLRRTNITYPNGRVMNYLYGTALSIDDHLNRISAQEVDGEGDNLVEYTYAGAAWQVQIQMPQPNLELTYKHQTGAPVGDAGDIYSGYDRFGRTQEILWLKNS
jgi:YD repeat-containing protein